MRSRILKAKSKANNWCLIWVAGEYTERRRERETGWSWRGLFSCVNKCGIESYGTEESFYICTFYEKVFDSSVCINNCAIIDALLIAMKRLRDFECNFSNWVLCHVNTQCACASYDLTDIRYLLSYWYNYWKVFLVRRDGSCGSILSSYVDFMDFMRALFPYW